MAEWQCILPTTDVHPVAAFLVHLLTFPNVRLARYLKPELMKDVAAGAMRLATLSSWGRSHSALGGEF